jgi:2'-hydroxyisoflavone reductase
MKIFLIGGTGLLGPAFIEEAAALGHETVCFNRRGIHPSGGQAIAGDRNDATALRAAMLAAHSETVVDMIPFTEPQALGLAAVLADLRLPLLAASSMDVYRAAAVLNRQEPPPYEPCPIREDGALRSLDLHRTLAYDKLTIERHYLALPGDVAIFRLPFIYGGIDTRRVEDYAERLARREKIVLHPTFAAWKVSRALHRNCAYALALALGRPGHLIYNVAEAVPQTETEWIEQMARALHIDAKITLDPAAAVPMGADFKQPWWVATDKIRSELDYTEKHDPFAGLKDNLARYLASVPS